MRKVMLLAAVVAMVLAAAVPAIAQTQAVAVNQQGTGNVACVQQAINNNNQVAVSQYGDAININAQAIAQECNITVEQVNVAAKKEFTVTKAGKVVVTKATASASAPAAVQYKAAAPAAVQYKAAAPAQYQYSAPAAVQYQYASASASAAPAALPETGGSSLIALGAGVLLVAGGLLARRIVR